MCLSRVYKEDKSEENCIMEEAARIDQHGSTVDILNLFGDEKHLHGYSVSTVDLLKNYVLLKKEDAPEEHDHSHDHEDIGSEAGKLEILLSHLLDHNRDHINDIKKWAAEAEKAGYAEVAALMDEIAGFYKEASVRFGKAIQGLQD